MWLLDANIDVHLRAVLADLGIDSATAADRGWKALSDRHLVAAAVEGGFDCLVTRDRLFGESASRALRRHENFSVVLITLPQRRWQEYCQLFLEAGADAPVDLKPGSLVEWPVCT